MIDLPKWFKISNSFFTFQQYLSIPHLIKTSDTPHYENVPFEVPKGWVWTDIENICSKIGSGSTPRGSNYSSKGIPFFRSQNIYNNGLVYEDIKFRQLYTNLH